MATKMENAKRYEYTDKWGEKITLFFVRGEYQTGGNLFVESVCEYFDEDCDEACSEPYSPVTLNFGDFGPCDQSEAYVDTNNSGHLIQWLVDEKHATYTGEWVHSGFCDYPQVRFSDAFLAGMAEYGGGKD